MSAAARSEKPHLAIVKSARKDNRAFALSYRNDDIVELFADRHSVSRDRAEHLFAQLKMWMWAAHVGRVRVCPTHEMDEIWHHFILHTREYARYCTRAFGGFFHHHPTPVHARGRNDIVKRAESAARELSAVAQSEFGDMIDHALWFDKKPDECGYTCEECCGEHHEGEDANTCASNCAQCDNGDVRTSDTAQECTISETRGRGDKNACCANCEVGNCAGTCR